MSDFDKPEATKNEKPLTFLKPLIPENAIDARAFGRWIGALIDAGYEISDEEDGK